MKYVSTQFSIVPPSEDLMQACRELLADACGDGGYESFEDTDDGLTGYIQQDQYSDSIVEAILADFPIEGTFIDYVTNDVPDLNWNAIWEEGGFSPILVDNMVTIYDARHTESTDSFSTPIQIGISTKNAFGTGTHETTRMIVSTLLSLPLSGRRVLDCGCGTGILSIAALKFGAAEAIGYDIDEWSVDNAQHNAQINEVSDHFDVLLGNVSVLSHVEGIFNVVMANINRNILLADMEQFHSVMANDALLVLSGFYEEDAPMLLERAASLGMHEVSRKTEAGWCCLVLGQ